MNKINFLNAQWRSVFGGMDTHQPLFDKLIAHYQQPNRHYHNITHLYECFLWFDEIKDKLYQANLVAMALFYHDVIYDSKSRHNEQMSADMMKAELSGILDDTSTNIIYQYILATKNHHNFLPLHDKYKNDLDYLLDMDLAILGSNPQRFDEYQAQIRQEYAWVNCLIYKFKRKSVLKQFYDKDKIYLTDYFYDKLENRARENLKTTL